MKLSDTTASVQTSDASGQQWPDVNRYTGDVDEITAETLNKHYATISTDPLYVALTQKQLATDTDTPLEYAREWEVFRMLDSLQPTAAIGLELI